MSEFFEAKEDDWFGGFTIQKPHIKGGDSWQMVLKLLSLINRQRE